MSYELHEPTFDGITTDRWTEPDWSEMAGDEPETVAGHFLLCEDVFPPGSVGELELAVVDERSQLNRNALADAIYGPHSVETLDVNEEFEEAVKEYATELLQDHFESMPETLPAVDEQLLAWQEEQAERAHEVEQKMHTDDEARYHEAKDHRQEITEERPETGE